MNKFLHSEVNQSIQHIILQDQDGQNTNMVEMISGKKEQAKALSLMMILLRLNKEVKDDKPERQTSINNIVVSLIRQVAKSSRLKWKRCR